MQALAEELHEGFCEIVVEQGAQTTLSFLQRLTANQTVDVLGIAVDQLSQDVDTQIARRTCNQHIAQFLALTRTEEAQRVALQEVVDSRIVKVGNRGIGSRSFFYDFTSNQLSQLARCRIGKYVAIGHVQSCLICFDDDTGNDERRTTKFEEIISCANLVHL